MTNIDKHARQVSRYDLVSGYMQKWPDGEFVYHSDYQALLDELEASEKKTVEIPTFDGYVPHVARELQAAFRIACDNAGINVPASAGKGEAS